MCFARKDANLEFWTRKAYFSLQLQLAQKLCSEELKRLMVPEAAHAAMALKR